MRGFAVALALLVLQTGPAGAAAARLVVLSLPHMPSADEEVVLLVRAGVMRRGMEIDVYGDGARLGVVSPFALRAGQEAGTYTIPLPRRMTLSGRVTIRLVLTDAGSPPRAPTSRELRGVTLRYVSVTR